ncbi:MAG: hypothetical protein RBS68_03275 [Anaerolineales bacterium]|jgi:transposase|nr:hypothetical protein [Anaerolineales bacterium]
MILAIQTRPLTKRFGALTAVDDLPLEIRAGEIFGFLGPNGAGKTTAIWQRARLFGWRIYGTNQPAADFSLEKLVCAYRDEYLVERNFGRLKGKSLALTPMYLQDDNRATGLIRLLSIGLRALTLLEHVVREDLAKTGQKPAGVYAGNPKRETATPKAETILRVFKNIYLTTIQVAGQTHQQITPLNDVQRQILALCDLPANLYDMLLPNLQNPYPK